MTTRARPNLRSAAPSLTTINVPAVLMAGFAALAAGVTAQAQETRLPTDPVEAVEFFDLRQRAMELYDRGEWRRSEPLLAELVGTGPADGELLYRLARVRHRLGRVDGTIDAYRSTLEHGYRYGAWICYQVARLFVRSGLSAEARRDSSLGWIGRALDAGWDDRRGIASDTMFAELRADPRFQKLVGALPDRDLTRVEGWRHDVDYLVEEARRLHTAPDRPAVSTAFDSAVARLKERIPELSNDRIVLELSRLMTLLGDGHSGIYGPGPDSPLAFDAGSLPLLFYGFEDGLFVVDAMEDARRWIGSRVVRFGNRPASEILRSLDDYVHHDNAMTVRWLGTRFMLPTLGFLHGIGATDDPTRATLTLERPDGSTRDVIFEAGDHVREFRRKLRPPPDPDVARPRWLSRVDTNYWTESLSGRGALYLQFNQVRDAEEGPSIAAFADSLRARLDATGAASLIVDVRHNNGGNNGLLRPLVRTLVWWEQDAPDHRIFVVTGRNTFSAAQNFVNRVERWTDAIFVGEPSSSGPNFTGEETPLVLPYSRVRGSISNRHWQDSDPDDRRPWIAPDMPIGLTSTHYFAGRDPALQAIFELLDRDTSDAP